MSNYRIGQRVRFLGRDAIVAAIRGGDVHRIVLMRDGSESETQIFDPSDSDIEPVSTFDNVPIGARARDEDDDIFVRIGVNCWVRVCDMPESETRHNTNRMLWADDELMRLNAELLDSVSSAAPATPVSRSLTAARFGDLARDHFDDEFVCIGPNVWVRRHPGKEGDFHHGSSSFFATDELRGREAVIIVKEEA